MRYAMCTSASLLASALALVAGGCAVSSAPETELGSTSQPVTSTYFYFRCNATGWGADASNRMLDTGSGPVAIEFNMFGTEDACNVLETGVLNGWGAWQNRYVLPQGGAFQIPGTRSLVGYAGTDDAKFAVSASSAGRVRAVYDPASRSLTLAPVPDVPLSLIKNGAFDEGIAYWQTYVDPRTGAGTSIETTSDYGVTQAVSTVNPDGASYPAWYVQLSQGNFTLQQGQAYRLEFDATTSSRHYPDHMDAVVEHNGSPWTPYLPTQTVRVDPGNQSFSYPFLMQAPTDPASRVAFNLGSHSGVIFIDNVRLIPNHGQLVNGDFSVRPFGWTTYVNPAATAYLTVGLGDARASIQNGGTAPWHVQIFQGGLRVEQGRTYELAFDVRTTNNTWTGMDVAVERNGGDYASYLGTEQPSFAGTWKNREYTPVRYIFTMTQPTDPVGRIVFNMGNRIPADISIDNVRFAQVADNLVANGNFSAGSSGWQSWIHDSVSGEIAFRNKRAYACKSGYTNLPQPWYLQLMTSGLRLETGHTYKLSFDLAHDVSKVEISAPVQVLVEHNGYPYTTYMAPQSFTASSFYPFDGFTTYETQFVMDKPTDDNARVTFNFGNMTSGFGGDCARLDNVLLQKID